MKKFTLAEILDADLTELTAWGLRGGGAGDLATYARVIERFQRGDAAFLEAAMADLAPGSPVRIATQLRLEILRHAFTSLTDSKDLARGGSPWAGELAILVGHASELQGEKSGAQRWYRLAVAGLERIGATRKAVRAMHNVVALESQLHPDRNVIPLFHDIYLKSMRLPKRDTAIAGLALMAISRDYQRLGAARAALKYCDRALRLLEREQGTLPYFLAIAHRCHLHLELRRFEDARADYEQASSAPFPAVAEALRLLEHAFAPLRPGKRRPA